MKPIDVRAIARAIAVAALAVTAPASSRAGSSLDQARALLIGGHFAAAGEAARAILAGPQPVAAEDSAQAIDVVLEVLFRTYRWSRPEAVELAERGVALRSHQGRTAPGLATSLAWLADALSGSRRIAEADSVMRIAEKECERAGTTDGLEGARVHDHHGEVDFRARRYANAIAQLERALAILRRMLPAADPRIADEWNKIAGVAQTIDDRDAADHALHSVIAMSEHGLAPDHPFVARAWMGLARERHMNQDYAAALTLSERALALLDRQPDADPNLVAYTCLQVSWDASDAGDDRRSIEACERAWRLFSAADGEEAPQTVAALSTLAEYSVWAGDCVRANALAETSLAVARRARGEGPEESWSEWETLSLARSCVGDLRGALEASGMAIEGLRRAGLDNGSNALIALRRRGMIFEALGQMDSAGVAYRTALARGLARSGPQSRDVFMAKDHLASWYLRVGKADSARRLVEFITPEVDSVHGPQSREAGRARALLAGAIAAGGDSAGALPPALRAEAIGREEFRAQVRGFGERQALAEGTTRARGLDLALALGAAHGITDAQRRDIWDALIRSRSLVFDEMAARRHERAGLQDSTGIALRTAREELARVLSRGPGSDSKARFDQRVLDATDRCDRAERAAAFSSVPVRLDRARASIGLAEVEAALAEGDALLAFAKYTVERGSRKVESYAALARSPRGAIAILPLGPADAIEARVTAWRAELSRSLPADPATRRAAERRCNAAGERLRRAIWDPARGALIGARRVIVIPDGVLALIPLQALPIGADRYLVDSSPLLVQLAAERDLVRPADVPSGRGLLAMGGMNYDAGTKSPALLAAAETADRGLPPCREFGDVRFTPLAGTGEEAQDVSRLFARSSLGGEPVELLAGAEATEAACRARAPGRRVIHLATHGFYVDPACALPAGVATRGTAGLMPATDLPASAPVDPLRLCGIAFAGANQRAAATDGANDGVLTAGEVASLDLEGTKIVTLSACESGLGIPVSGEGVLGLERAFHIAGADVVVMSLWPVNDRAAREWMGDFYRTLWLEHRDPAEAARAASRAALQRLRAAGRPTHPGEWAMFVPSGLMR